MRLAKILIIPSIWASFVQARPGPQATSQQETPNAEVSNEQQSLGPFSPDNIPALVGAGALLLLVGTGTPIYLLRRSIGKMRGEIDALSGKTKQLDQQFKKVDGAYMRMDQRRQASNKIFKARIRALEESTSQRLKPVNMDQFMLDWSAAAECIYTKLGLFELERQKYHVSGADMMWAARQCGLDIEFLDVQSVWEVEIKPGMEPMNVPRRPLPFDRPKERSDNEGQQTSEFSLIRDLGNNVKSSFMRALKIEEGGPARQRAPGFFAGRKAGSFARPVVPLGIR